MKGTHSFHIPNGRWEMSVPITEFNSWPSKRLVRELVSLLGWPQYGGCVLKVILTWPQCPFFPPFVCRILELWWITIHHNSCRNESAAIRMLIYSTKSPQYSACLPSPRKSRLVAIVALQWFELVRNLTSVTISTVDYGQCQYQVCPRGLSL